MNEVKEKWPEIIEHLRVEHELLNVSFNTWIKPLKVYDLSLIHIYFDIIIYAFNIGLKWIFLSSLLFNVSRETFLRCV